MAETTVSERRDDLDILEDIDHLIAHYPPLMKDRHAIKCSIKEGFVTVSGHTQSPNTRRYFLDNLPLVDGVTGVNADQFFDDETIRLDAGRSLPFGVRVGKVQYGVVILTGELPEGANATDITTPIQQIPGVQRVLMSF